MLDICLLGTGGMLPLPDRHLTAMLARYNGRKLLIDCGEGTQVTMRLLGWGYKTLDITDENKIDYEINFDNNIVLDKVEFN